MEYASTWAIWLTIITGLIFLYKYLTRNDGYFESRGIPCDKCYPIVGTELSLFTTPMHELDNKRVKKHGRIYGTYFMSVRGLNIADPEIIRHILVKDFPSFVNRQIARTGLQYFDSGLIAAVDDDWKRIRSVVSPTFSSGKLRKMTSMVKNTAKKLTHHVAEFAEKKDSVNVKDEFAKYSAEVLATCAFGIKFDAFKNPNHKFLQNTKKVFQSGSQFLFVFILISILPRILNYVRYALVRLSGLAFFQDVAGEVIENRKANVSQENKPVDFLQLMLDAKDEETENPESDKQDLQNGKAVENNEKKPQWTKTLSDEEIISQCSTFLFAGHDSIASAIAFVAYNLARNQDIQETLLREVDETWDKYNDIDYDIVNKMTYLNAVISETLRIQTVATRITRQAKEDYHIPNTNITIPDRCIISIPVYAIHHDPEFFPDPEKFDPERFLPENKDSIRPYTYMPFGDGPRNCVSMRFALMEMKFCLAYILRYIKFLPSEQTMKPLEYVIGFGALQAKNGIFLRPEKRRNCELI